MDKWPVAKNVGCMVKTKKHESTLMSQSQL